MRDELIEMAEAEVVDLAAQPQDSGLLSANADNILYLADKADKYIEALNRIMDAALRITSELDWCLIGGKPYLQESGATKVARLFGISWSLSGRPYVETDDEGYKTYTYKARFMMKDDFVECEGSRSMREDFFAKTRNGMKRPDEIDARDVRMAAYTNCINNGIKRLIPNLRNIDLETLERAGLDTSKISGYTFKEGSRGGTGKAAEQSGLFCSKCNSPVTQKVASFSQSKFGAILCMNCQKEVNS